MVRKMLFVLLAQLLWFPAAIAQDSEGSSDAETSQPPRERHPCKKDPKKREFDFWVGTWDVSNQGNHAGVNEIKLILGDCVLLENWTSASPYTGKSFNYYDTAEGHWRQIWVDDYGGVIEFTGQVEDGTMYYTATTRNPADDSKIEHKLTFSQNEDGSVRQHWEQSTDGGETWKTVWDGHYVRK